MNTQQDITKLMLQTRQYEFIDGLRDLQLAVIFASLGATSWLILDFVYLPYIANLMKVFGRSAVWLSLLLALLPAILGLGMLSLISFVRRRWLWQHTGMVKSLNQMVPRWSVVFATIIYVLSIVLVFNYKQANTLLILQM